MPCAGYIGFMNGNELKKLVPAWAEVVGVRKARLALQQAGLSYSLTEKLIKGQYYSEPKGHTVDALRLVLKDFIQSKAS